MKSGQQSSRARSYHDQRHTIRRHRKPPRPCPATRPRHKFVLFRKPTKDGETGKTFFMPSPFCDFSLFNMLIINSLNKQKSRKYPF
jgi:hypothetical protein